MGKEAIIKVEGLSKKYLLTKNVSVKSDTLYGNFFNSLKNLKNFARKENTEEFLALDDVSFEVQQGDRVGIIGRNGAGKSTLLKIISRISPPTKGRIEINGRLASLLEVGTGFHGDLSGSAHIVQSRDLGRIESRRAQPSPGGREAVHRFVLARVHFRLAIESHENHLHLRNM